MKKLIAGALLGLAISYPATADDFDKIKADGKITVATEAAFKPFEYVEDGKIIGLGADLLAEIISDMDVEVEQLDLPFQGILAGLAAGQYDMVATSVSITEERSKVYAFTRPIAAIQTVVVVLESNDSVRSLEDLNGILVGTQLGSAPEEEARALNAQLKSGGGSGFDDLRLFQTFPDTAFALRSGQVDAIVIGNTTAGEFMKTSPGTFKVATHYGNPTLIAWVVRPGNPKLLKSVNSTIGRLSDSGKLGEMQEKWIGTKIEVPADNYLPEGAVQ